MRVTLVTTWDKACGIAEYGWYWREAVQAADPSIQVAVESTLHPSGVLGYTEHRTADWVWLNYHAALHSQWLPEHVRHAQALGVKVGITFHDTGVPNSEQCKRLHAVADAFVIHEPADDLPGAVYMRQGVPGWPRGAHQYNTAPPPIGFSGRPVVGTVGFPFPWKHYDLLAEASALAGWALVLIAPGATPEQVARWTDLNPVSEIVPHFLPREAVLGRLHGCDATAFLYANANTGTSGAIRQGIAARKPVLASHPSVCRQFRDLRDEPLTWLTDLSPQGVAEALSQVWLGHLDPGMVYLAERNSWARAGQVYAGILGGAQ